MKFLEKKLTLFALLTIFSGQGFADIDFPKKMSKNKPVSVEWQSEYFYTHSNFIGFGQYSNLEDKNQLYYISGDLSVQYSPFAWLNLEIFGDSILKAYSLTGESPRLGSSLTYTGAGLTLLQKYKKLGLNIGVKSGFALRGVPQNSSSIVFSDGAHFIEPNFLLSYEYKKLLYFFSNTKFKYRTHGLSSIASYQLGGSIQTPAADIGAYIDYSMPLFFPDIYYNTPESRTDLLNRVNGGSYKFYSIHPYKLSFTAWMELYFKFVALTTYANFDTYGKNSSKGLTLGAIAKFRINTYNSNKESRRFLDNYKKSLRSKKQKANYYKEENDTFISDELQQELKSLR